MSKAKASYRNDIIVGVLGSILTWVGADIIHKEIIQPGLLSSDWRFGLCLVIFGSMIVGVAVNKVSLKIKVNSDKNISQSKNGKSNNGKSK